MSNHGFETTPTNVFGSRVDGRTTVVVEKAAARLPWEGWDPFL